MKLNPIKILFLLTLFVACTSREENNKLQSQKSEEQPNINSHVHCYRYANKTDTIFLMVLNAQDEITGMLVYNLDGKDKNTGTIKGSMKDDLLVADYLFMSEGIQSTRQIAFKLKDNSFIEGYGEIETQNDKVHFKDMGALKFNDSMKLIEIECQ